MYGARTPLAVEAAARDADRRYLAALKQITTPELRTLIARLELTDESPGYGPTWKLVAARRERILRRK